MQKFQKLTEYIDSLHNDVGVPSCGLAVFKNHEKIYEHFIGFEDTENTKTPLGEFSWDGAAGSCFSADTENGIGMIYVQHMFM